MSTTGFISKGTVQWVALLLEAAVQRPAVPTEVFFMSTVPSDKCWNAALNNPQPLPSTMFPVHHSQFDAA